MTDEQSPSRASRRRFLTATAGAIGLAVGGRVGPVAAGEPAQAPGRSTVRDRLWIFTCVAGADDEGWGLPGPSRMTPAEGAFYLGVPNLMLIRWQGKPAILGSLWSLIPAGIVVALVVVRTVFEDRLLHEELDGYREYAERVRCRLVPGVW